MEKKIELSDRLAAVAGMVTKGNVVCDVGCDHGFVSIYLIQNEISPRVIAMDVNEGPLKAAREHIGECRLADYIETRLSDGVKALEEGEADTLICAGMGGRLMKRILEEGKEKLQPMKELILQPQSEIQGMREYLRKQGYRIVDENMILEEGKYYPMMRVELETAKAGQCGTCGPSGESNTPKAPYESAKLRIEDKYGTFLLQKQHPVLKTFLEREAGICTKILANLEENGSGQCGRWEEIMFKLNDIKTALSYYD